MKDGVTAVSIHFILPPSSFILSLHGENEVTLALRGVTVEAATLLLPPGDFLERAVHGQELPVAALRVEARRALDHHGEELRRRVVRLRQLLADDDGAGGEFQVARERRAREFVGVDDAVSARVVAVALFAEPGRRGARPGGRVFEPDSRLPP